jgi:hypothetical protein
VHAGAQLLGIERFDQIIVRSRIEAGDDVRAAVSRRQQDDVHVRVPLVLSDPPAQLGAVGARHHPVQNRHRDPTVLVDDSPRLLAVACDDDIKTPALERTGEHHRAHRLVVGN